MKEIVKKCFYQVSTIKQHISHFLFLVCCLPQVVWLLVYCFFSDYHDKCICLVAILCWTRIYYKINFITQLVYNRCFHLLKLQIEKNHIAQPLRMYLVFYNRFSNVVLKIIVHQKIQPVSMTNCILFPRPTDDRMLCVCNSSPKI